MISYLTNIRTGIFGSSRSFSCLSSRIILEASAPFSWDIESKKDKTIITFPGAYLNMPPGIIRVYDGLINTLAICQDAVGTPQVIINTSEPSGNSPEEVPGLPHRLILDLDRSPLGRYFRNQSLLLDPAYDGKKRGAMSPTGLPEHIPTLQIARRLAQLIAQVPARVNITRRDAEFIPVGDRLQMCRELKSSLFLAIATGVEKEKPQSGFRIKHYYGKENNKLLAACLEEEIKRRISIPPRGITPVNLTLLRRLPIPAALVEIACISHRLDEGLLRDVDFHKAAAQGLFNGVLSFFRRLNNRG
ncbi:MAG: N-acetylmuramoyl-L-alanine amidase [Firmicutes bacterium]|nr:N-acetylmuramoyl-L-alanine amidase [Bacillota bacterium]